MKPLDALHDQIVERAARQIEAFGRRSARRSARRPATSGHAQTPALALLLALLRALAAQSPHPNKEPAE